MSQESGEESTRSTERDEESCRVVSQDSDVVENDVDAVRFEDILRAVRNHDDGAPALPAEEFLEPFSLSQGESAESEPSSQTDSELDRLEFMTNSQSSVASLGSTGLSEQLPVRSPDIFSYDANRSSHSAQLLDEFHESTIVSLRFSQESSQSQSDDEVPVVPPSPF